MFLILDKSQGARDIFTICLGDTQGILSAGEMDPELYVGNLYWVDIQDPAYYSVRMKGFHVSNHSISLVISTPLSHVVRRYRDY